MTRAELSSHSRTLARLALGVTIVLIPFRQHVVWLARPMPPLYGDYTNFAWYWTDVAVLVTLALWLISLALRPRRLSLGPLFLSLPLAGVVGFGWVSVLFSVDPSLSLYHAVRLIVLSALYLFLVNEVENLRQIIWSVALQVFLQSAVGLGQVMRQHSLGLARLGEWELDPAWNGVSVVWAEGVRSLRAYGLSDHPNILGGCLAVALILLAAWYATADEKWRAPGVALFALGAVGLLLTFSRAAWLAFGIGASVDLALLLAARQAQQARVWIGLLGASLVLVLPMTWLNAAYLGMRFSVPEALAEGSYENRSVVERAVLNDVTSQLVAEHPVTGVGLGAAPVALLRTQPNFPFNYQPAHVVLLDVAAEIGLLGALCYLMVLLTPWAALWRARARWPLPPALLGVSGALAALTVVGLLDYYPWLLVPGRLWQWLAWGLWGAFYQRWTTGATHVA